MDFASILTMITNFFSSIPQTIFGIDTLYIGVGLLALIILFWLISKARKAKPKRELHDLIPEEKEEVLDESEEESGEELEDGFMPSNITSEAQEIHVTEEPEEQKIEESVEEAEPEAVVAVEETTPAAPVEQREVAPRKKRESTRDGRKIAKADFADFSGCRLLIAEDNLQPQKSAK